MCGRQSPPPPYCLHVPLMRGCWQMLPPPHSLHRLLTPDSKDRALTAGDLEVSARALGPALSGDVNELGLVLSLRTNRGLWPLAPNVQPANAGGWLASLDPFVLEPYVRPASAGGWLSVLEPYVRPANAGGWLTKLDPCTRSGLADH